MKFMTKSRVGLLAMMTISTLAGAAIGGTAMAYEGHMETALSDLQAARSALIAAEGDKGGHREAAINLVNQAIGEVNAGIAYTP